MAQRQPGSQPEIGGQPRIRQRRARSSRDVGVINAAGRGELGLQLCRCGPQDARQCFDSLHIALTQGGGGKPGKLDADEYTVVQTHTVIGSEVLSEVVVTYTNGFAVRLKDLARVVEGPGLGRL